MVLFFYFWSFSAYMVSMGSMCSIAHLPTMACYQYTLLHKALMVFKHRIHILTFRAFERALRTQKSV